VNLELAKLEVAAKALAFADGNRIAMGDVDLEITVGIGFRDSPLGPHRGIGDGRPVAP